MGDDPTSHERVGSEHNSRKRYRRTKWSEKIIGCRKKINWRVRWKLTSY